MTLYKKNNKALLLSIFIVILLSCVTSVQAQNNTNSPYTRFGYGQVYDQTFSIGQSMGGTALGLRSKTSINTANPASYSAIDSTTFLFEFGASLLMSRFASDGVSTSTTNGNLEYLAIQFPVNHWMGFSAGLLPYTFVGYDFSSSDSTKIGSGTTNYSYTEEFIGYGGMNQVYLGTSVDLFSHLSLGLNVYYIFGNIDYERDLVYDNTGTTSTYYSSELNLHSFNWRAGLQYHNVFEEKHALTVGAIFELQTDLSSDMTTIAYSTDTVTTTLDNAYQLPTTIGLGLNYTYNNKYMFALDYNYMDFAGAKFAGKTDSLNIYQSLNAGFQYVRNDQGRKFWDRVRWRCGGNYRQSYVKIGPDNSYAYSITAGMGIPLKNSLSLLNINFEYGQRLNNDYTNIDESYFKIGLNMSLNESWFQKRKIR